MKLRFLSWAPWSTERTSPRTLDAEILDISGDKKGNVQKSILADGSKASLIKARQGSFSVLVQIQDTGRQEPAGKVCESFSTKH